MSIHGNQLLTPFFMRRDANLAPVSDTEEIALAYYLLTKELKQGDKIQSFARLLWPFLSIQGVISTHIVLDGLLLFSKKGKFTNPPRQPLIGHILRNVDNRTRPELLNRIIEILTYKDIEAQEIGSGEESEFQTLDMESLLSYDYLNALMKLIPLLQSLPISEYMPLETAITTEKALDFSQKYRNTVETMRGNALRWETLIELIGKEANAWITELIVELKDTKARYSSQINKTSSTIDLDRLTEQLNKEKDKIEQWKENEKKKVIENVALLFKNIERSLDDCLKKNRFFSQSEVLKTKKFEDLSLNINSHFIYLREVNIKLMEFIESSEQKFEDSKKQILKFDEEASEKVNQYKSSLDSKLEDRDKQLLEVEQEKQENISNLEHLRTEIEDLFNKIVAIIQNKQQICIRESEELKSWSIKDNEAELFSKPIQWFYLPVYAVFIQTEGTMDDRMNIVFPGFIDPNSPYECFSKVFSNLKDIIDQTIENDMKIRSNFEFSCDNKNLLKDTNLLKKIQKGVSMLKSKGLIGEEVEKKLRENFKLISNL